jgi:transcriptional regulator with XRE-family HTH domain
MAFNDLPANLKLLCSYVSSISEASRQLNINRQQLHSYLSGASMPSIKNIQRICNFFGVEEFEIILGHDEFRNLISLRKPKIADLDPLGNYIVKMSRINPDSTNNLEQYVGYYHSYFKPHDEKNKIMKALIKVFSRNGFVYTKNIESYSGIKRHKQSFQKYTGIMFHSGEKIFVYEREESVGKMMWTSVFHPVDQDQSAELTGLTMGITGGGERDIACYRIVWERINKSTKLRDALRSCGTFEPDDPSVPDDIKSAIENGISADECGLVARRL